MRPPAARAWRFDVGPRLERGVRHHRGSNGKTCSVPLGLLPLLKKNEGKPLGADQAGLPRTCLPPRTKLNEAESLRTAAGTKNSAKLVARSE